MFRPNLLLVASIIKLLRWNITLLTTNNHLIVKLLNFKLAFTIFILIFPIIVNSQKQDNAIITIEEIYNHILVNEISNTKSFVSPVSNHSQNKNTEDHSITILNSAIVKEVISDFKNEWNYIIFNNITVTEIDSDNILVTGIISGKNIEKGIINHMAFQHTWLLENGAVVKFIQ